MKLIPSIDIEDGVAVKRVAGRRGTGLRLGDPLELAERIAGYGFTWVHVVDLDAAEKGKLGKETLGILRRIAGLGLRVEYGGGVRSLEVAEAVCGAGASRLVIGSAWLRDPGILGEARKRTGCEVLAAVEEDRDGFLVTHGWREKTPLSLEEAVKTVAASGATGLFYTQVWVEGSLGGPDLGRARRLRELYPGFIVFSGGISSLRDVEALASLGFDAVVVGMALYTGRIRWEEAARYA